jgi:hypothetical protein
MPMDQKTFSVVAGVSGAPPSGADLYELASRGWTLVGTDVGELGRSCRRRWPRFFRVETLRARRTLKSRMRHGLELEYLLGQRHRRELSR